MFTSSSGVEVPVHGPRVDVMHSRSITDPNVTTGFNVTNVNGESHGQGLTNNFAKAVVALVMVALVLVALLGNVLVCAAIYSDRSLRRRKANLFLVSLAVADMLMAAIVMPFAIGNSLSKTWTLGADWCVLWISFDVMSATASIQNLCLVCVDRFLQIQFPLHYQRAVSRRKIKVSIACAWVISFLVSFLPILSHWHESELMQFEAHQCLFQINLTYAIVSSSVSFYIPCIIMFILYFRLFHLAAEHAHHLDRFARAPPRISVTVRLPPKTRNVRAAITLGVIMGVFLVCWLPFFIVNPIAASCGSCVSDNVFQLLTWMGYSNSCANPIIYSLFNMEFRQAFYRQLHLRLHAKMDLF